MLNIQEILKVIKDRNTEWEYTDVPANNSNDGCIVDYIVTKFKDRYLIVSGEEVYLNKYKHDYNWDCIIETANFIGNYKEACECYRRIAW